MNLALAAIVGYLIGVIPTANTIARSVGLDLRSQGSGNPGANNALQLGGPGLAAAVLFTEMAKGAVAAWLGGQVADDPGMVIAGLAAVTGNRYNIFYRFQGGKGLGITAGVLLVTWPTALIPLLAVIALAAWATHSTAGATVIAIVSGVLLGAVWVVLDLSTGWGIEDNNLLLVLVFGLGLLVAPRDMTDVRFRRQSPA